MGVVFRGGSPLKPIPTLFLPLKGRELQATAKTKPDNADHLFQFQIKDDIKAARKKATEAYR
jgi:hypothetical protein